MLNVCLAMTEWVTFEADVWNTVSLSNAKTFQFEHWINIYLKEAHPNSFPMPVLPGKATIALRILSNEQQIFFKHPDAVYFSNGRMAKVKRTGTSAPLIS